MPRSVEPSAVKVVASRKNKGELRAKGAGSVPSADRLHRLPLRVCVQEPDNSGDTFEFAAITPPPTVSPFSFIFVLLPREDVSIK